MIFTLEIKVKRKQATNKKKQKNDDLSDSLEMKNYKFRNQSANVDYEMIWLIY